jgi:hypothetical protein
VTRASSMRRSSSPISGGCEPSGTSHSRVVSVAARSTSQGTAARAELLRRRTRVWA